MLSRRLTKAGERLARVCSALAILKFTLCLGDRYDRMMLNNRNLEVKGNEDQRGYF